MHASGVYTGIFLVMVILPRSVTSSLKISMNLGMEGFDQIHGKRDMEYRQ